MSEVLLIILWEYQNVEKLFQRTHPSNRVDSTSILHRYVEDQISTNFHVISTYFFDVISWSKNPRRSHVFFEVISMVEKSTSFPRTFFGVISLVEKCLLFPRTFFNVILVVEKSALFARTFFRWNFDGNKFDVVFG